MQKIFNAIHSLTTRVIPAFYALLFFKHLGLLVHRIFGLVHLICNVQYSTLGFKATVNHLEVVLGSKPNDSLCSIADLVAIQRGAVIRTMSQPGLNSAISVVHPAELSSETQQTPGSLRMFAIAAMHGIVSSLWAGVFVVESSAKTGIHHHGEQDTVVYVLDGEACVL
jgi:hypothetical protein